MGFGKEYVIIGVANILFIAVVIILIFVPVPCYVIAIVSAIFLLLSSILAFYFLILRARNENDKWRQGDIEMGDKVILNKNVDGMDIQLRMDEEEKGNDNHGLQQQMMGK